ncbi:hypothetical protein F4859DRAFT_230316 [Xylaria cf. heliscus]|nr:hypothetical protein F4859DRAFT_230316 [Xylaria cf. heliscus]
MKDQKSLIEESDGLPLALAIAGAYLEQTSTQFGSYLAYTGTLGSGYEPVPLVRFICRPHALLDMAAVLYPDSTEKRKLSCTTLAVGVFRRPGHLASIAPICSWAESGQGVMLSMVDAGLLSHYRVFD